MYDAAYHAIVTTPPMVIRALPTMSTTMERVIDGSDYGETVLMMSLPVVGTTDGMPMGSLEMVMLVPVKAC